MLTFWQAVRRQNQENKPFITALPSLTSISIDAVPRPLVRSGQCPVALLPDSFSDGYVVACDRLLAPHVDVLADSFVASADAPSPAPPPDKSAATDDLEHVNRYICHLKPFPDDFYVESSKKQATLCTAESQLSTRSVEAPTPVSVSSSSSTVAAPVSASASARTGAAGGVRLLAGIVAIVRVVFRWQCRLCRGVRRRGQCAASCDFSRRAAVRPPLTSDAGRERLGGGYFGADESASSSPTSSESDEDTDVDCEVKIREPTRKRKRQLKQARFLSEMSCVIDDGTGQAQLYLDGPLVWKLLQLRDWCALSLSSLVLFVFQLLTFFSPPRSDVSEIQLLAEECGETIFSRGGGKEEANDIVRAKASSTSGVSGAPSKSEYVGTEHARAGGRFARC